MLFVIRRVYWSFKRWFHFVHIVSLHSSSRLIFISCCVSGGNSCWVWRVSILGLKCLWTNTLLHLQKSDTFLWKAVVSRNSRALKMLIFCWSLLYWTGIVFVPQGSGNRENFRWEAFFTWYWEWHFEMFFFFLPYTSSFFKVFVSEGTSCFSPEAPS